MPALRCKVESLSGRKYLLLGTASVTSLALYVFLAWRYPLGPNLSEPRASWASMVAPTWINATQQLLVYLGLTLAYLAALRLFSPSAAGHELSRRRLIPIIIITWLICSIALMFASPAGESHDVFDYLFRGRMMTEYKANPLSDVPESLGLSSPYIYYLGWRTNVDTYGPIWETASYSTSSGVGILARWLGWWGSTSPVCPQSQESCRLLILYITGYRVLAASLTGLSGWLIASIVGRT